MDERWAKIAALDLKSVRQKFELKKRWWWRLRNNSNRLENEYRQFLYLIVSNPTKVVVPWSHDLDDFWHQHILDTARYARDCDTILGQFIHHNPHLPEGSQPHAHAYRETNQMYREAFAETARKRSSRSTADVGCGSDMPVVFCEGGASTGQHHGGASSDHGGGHHDAGGSHGGGHGCGGHGGGHGCGGHGCGGGGGH